MSSSSEDGQKGKRKASSEAQDQERGGTMVYLFLATNQRSNMSSRPISWVLEYARCRLKALADPKNLGLSLSTVTSLLALQDVEDHKPRVGP
jgi:hypothetical protein